MPTEGDLKYNNDTNTFSIYTLEEWMDIDIDKKPEVCTIYYDNATSLRSIPYSDYVIDRYIPDPIPPIRYRSKCAYCGAPINDVGKCEYCGVGHQYLD